MPRLRNGTRSMGSAPSWRLPLNGSTKRSRGMLRRTVVRRSSSKPRFRVCPLLFIVVSTLTVGVQISRPAWLPSASAL